jgi:hypothetical membrane protein
VWHRAGVQVPRRLGAACGVLAPTAFVAGWLVHGARTPGYEPLEDAISRLAAEGAATRAGMTAALVAFGVLLPAWAAVLARELGVPSLRPVVTGAALATLGVAALPLTEQGGGLQDAGHAAAALTGYVAMAATPLVAARGLGPRASRASVATGVVAAVALLGSALTGSGGLQRLGLTVVDAWHVVLACGVLLRARP